MNSSPRARMRSLCIALLVMLSGCAKLTPDPTNGGTGGGTGGSSAASPTLSVVAGSIQGGGYLDGPVATALLGLSAGTGVSGVATDASGNIFFSDAANHVIRKLSAGGEVTTLAGSGLPGFADGTGVAAAFHTPGGLTIDSAGNVYVADTGNFSIRKVTSAGVVSTLAGFTPGPSVNPVSTIPPVDSNDLVRTEARFVRPLSVALDDPTQLKYIYVVDQDLSSRSIRKLTISSGKVTSVTTFAGPYSQMSGLIQPLPIATGRGTQNGGLFVGDGQVVRKLTTALSSSSTPAAFAGSGTLSGGTGYTDGLALSTARFTSIAGLAFNASGDLFVADVQSANIRRVANDAVGTVTTIAGSALQGSAYVPLGTGYADGSGNVARFGAPTAIATDSAGSLIIADGGNAALRKLVPASTAEGSVVSTVVGGPAISGSADGTGSNARFLNPTSVAVDSAGTVYVADTGNHTVRKITAAGLVTTIGSPGISGSTNGAASAARFKDPTGIAVDAAGTVYVADSGNHLIRKISPAGDVTTLAGNGTAGAVNAMGTQATFSTPKYLAIDSSGALFVLDAGNSYLRKISISVNGSQVTADVTTVVPSQSSALYRNSDFDSVAGLALDTSGNAYVASANNCNVWKVTTSGAVSVFAGTPQTCGENLDGTGTAALLSPIQAMAYDPSGALLLSTSTRMRRVVLSTAAVTTPYGTLIPAAAGVAASGSRTLYLTVNNGVAKVALP